MSKPTLTFLATIIVSIVHAQGPQPIDPYQIRKVFVKAGDEVKPPYRASFYKDWDSEHKPNETLRVGAPVFESDHWPMFLTYYVSSPGDGTPGNPEKRMYQLSFATFHGGRWTHARTEVKMGTEPEIKPIHDKFIQLTNDYDTTKLDNDIGRLITYTEIFTQYFVMDGNDLYRLEDMDSAQLRLSRNWIFARYGYRFKSKELETYFSKERWYVPKFDRVDPLLTQEDKDLIALLLKVEKQKAGK